MERKHKSIELACSSGFFIHDETCQKNLQKQRVELICKTHGKFSVQVTSILKIHKKTGSVKREICPSCRTVSVKFPEIVCEWDFKKNKVGPDQWSFGKTEKVHWKCKNCDKEFCCTVDAKRKLVNGCPHCSLATSSKMERMIFYFLSNIFEHTAHNDTFFFGDGKEEKFSYDIMVKSLNPPLVVEYDGQYYHKDRFVSDCEKNEKILKQGFRILRIRESGLNKTSTHDIEYTYIETYRKGFKEGFLELMENVLSQIELLYGPLNGKCIESFERFRDSQFDTDLIPKDFFIFPFVNASAAHKHPELIGYWDLKKNGFDLYRIAKSDSARKWWSCECGNSYMKCIESQVKAMKRGETPKCPKCSNKERFKKRVKLHKDDEYVYEMLYDNYIKKGGSCSMQEYREQIINHAVDRKETDEKRELRRLKIKCSCDSCGEHMEKTMNSLKKYGLICSRCKKLRYRRFKNKEKKTVLSSIKTVQSA